MKKFLEQLFLTNFGRIIFGMIGFVVFGSLSNWFEWSKYIFIAFIAFLLIHFFIWMYYALKNAIGTISSLIKKKKK